jgi:hypothetical protein
MAGVRLAREMQFIGKQADPAAGRSGTSKSVCA